MSDSSTPTPAPAAPVFEVGHNVTFNVPGRGGLITGSGVIAEVIKTAKGLFYRVRSELSGVERKIRGAHLTRHG